LRLRNFIIHNQRCYNATIICRVPTRTRPTVPRSALPPPPPCVSQSFQHNQEFMVMRPSLPSCFGRPKH
ncbi:unnamed protein product, partial [Ectocarpus sp. 6 AP-2014]